MKKLISLLVCVIAFSLIFTGCSCFPAQPQKINAVWWWDDELSEETKTQYFNFAKENNINQIYYCTSKFNEDTASFIKQANELGMEVFLLDGNYKWLHSAEQEQKLLSKIEKYQEYNNTYSDAKFKGIHLDIEPHQSKNDEDVSEEDRLPDELDFNTEQGEENLIKKLILLTQKLDITYKDIHFTYDIPFWLDTQIEIDGITRPAYEHMITYADNVVVMSYRDTAAEIYDVAKEELEFAKSIDKTITLSVECGNHGNDISFYEEGKQVLNKEIENLASLVPELTGMCYHHIGSWFNLKD